MARGESWLSCRPLLLLCLHLCKLLRTDARRKVDWLALLHLPLSLCLLLSCKLLL